MTIQPDDRDCTSGPCAVGQTDIFAEYAAGKTQRAKTDFRTSKLHQSLPAGTSPEMALIVRLVDLTATHDLTHTVGFPVDAVELSGNGRIRWVQGHRKKACAEKQE